MALHITSIKHGLHIAVLVLAGLACASGAVFLAYDAVVKKGALTTPGNYKYTISQSINNDVNYVKNSFYPDGPAIDNTAYITELTDTIASDFHYSYKASDAKQLEYTYSAAASIQGTYGVPGGTEDISNVWSRQFELDAPTTEQVNTAEFSIDKSVEIPFSEYLKAVEDFRLGLALPVGSELKVKFQVKVSGVIDGEEFTDMRTSTVSTPLNVQIFQLATKYDKTDTKEVIAHSPSNETQWRIQLELIAAGALSLIGVMFIGFAIHSRRNQTQYQRQLEKIYRYHDGIIIRTSKPAKISANKSVVPVKSFEDILNLEDETKSPIIASPASETATNFMIVEGDVVYQYTLGEEPIANVEDDELVAIEKSLEEPKTPAKPKRKATKKIKIRQ